jgi:hypothetical protein
VTEQPETPPTEGAPAWVPANPEKAEPASGSEPTAVQPPVDPSVPVNEPPVAAEPALAAEPAVAPVPPVPPPPVTPHAESDGAMSAATDDRPEIAIGAAFAGGFAVAMILKRLAR